MIIKIENLVKVYTTGSISLTALKGVNLEVKEGEFVAIMGSSGSGKSTLMNIIGCLDRATSGSYLLQGKDITEFDDDGLAEIRNKRIGFVFQSYNLLPKMDAVRNVELPLFYGKVSSEERLNKVQGGAQKGRPGGQDVPQASGDVGWAEAEGGNRKGPCEQAFADPRRRTYGQPRHRIRR